jgi:hypothetical protein
MPWLINERRMTMRAYATWLVNLALWTCLVILPLSGQADSTGEWSGVVSEEYPPITCDIGHLPVGASCSGSYCDNFQFLCGHMLRFVGTPGYEATQREWKGFISEEIPSYYTDCGNDAVITGLACKGKYCDNVSVECSTLKNYRPSSRCGMVGPFSEEQRGISFISSAGRARYPRMLFCTGSYCDNKYFYVCELDNK